MRVLSRRKGGLANEVEIEGGHTLLVNEPSEVGGTDTGPGPTQLLAASLASCIAVTIEMYAARKDWQLGEVEVNLEVTYDGFLPTCFEVSVRLSRELSETQRERLLAIARKCPVHRTLTGDTHVLVSEKVEPL